MFLAFCSKNSAQIGLVYVGYFVACSLDEACGIQGYVASMLRISLRFIRATMLTIHLQRPVNDED